VEKLDATYPGGLLTYVERAKQLMADYKNERQLFEGYTPSVSHFVSNFQCVTNKHKIKKIITIIVFLFFASLWIYKVKRAFGFCKLINLNI
jgi:hypothetical protein